MDDDRKKPFKPGGKRPGARPFGDRPPRGDRPGGDKPFGDRKSFGDKKSFGGDRKPSGDRKPYGDRPPREAEAPRRREPEAENPTTGERIAKRLARAGISSRRDAEALIADGRIKVNGVVLDSPARNVTANDRIELDNNPIPEIERTRLFVFHKPGGVVTTNKDPEGRRTVFDVLPKELPRLLTVGRLDINTEGLLLLTNDGGLARILELPATGWLRRYRVRVHGTVDEAKLAELKNGIAVDGVFYGSIEATLDRQQGSNAWLTIGLREGKNREVKNVLGALGLDVTRLIRISYGPFQLGELAEGAVHELKGRYLRDQLGDRLIAESGAVFDLPAKDAPAPAAPEARERRGEAPLNRKREREDHRSEMLDRLQTKPSGRFGDKPGRFGDKSGARPTGKFERGGKRDEERREPTPQRPRGANVWMAPGARPRSQKKVEEEAAERAARQDARDANTRMRGGPRRDDHGAEGRSFKDRPRREEGGDKPFRPRSTEGRPFVKRDRPEGSGEGRSFKPAGDKPFRPRPAEGRPFVKRDRPEGSGEGRSFKPAGDKPFRPRPAEGRPARSSDGERSGSGERPQNRSFAPKGGKPAFGKPTFNKPRTGDRPRPDGDKPHRPDRPNSGGNKGGPRGGSADRRR
jgi:23S rRNA pseudouridine2605 synthase